MTLFVLDAGNAQNRLELSTSESVVDRTDTYRQDLSRCLTVIEQTLQVSHYPTWKRPCTAVSHHASLALSRAVMKPLEQPAYVQRIYA
jgi:hypothetical protein